VPGGHDGTVKARPDATVHLDKESGVIENLEQVFLRDLAASSFQLRRRIEHSARVPASPRSTQARLHRGCPAPGIAPDSP
jgi:hypothetical protein